MTTQNIDQTKQKLSVDVTAKKLFVEPEISAPVDVLEATAFFQPITGASDVAPNPTI